MNRLNTAADLHLLAVFKAVVECGGFGAAQVALNSTQPTISNQMATLEARLGVRLCDRGRTGFRLTPQGQAVYESLQALFAAHDMFNKHVAALNGRMTGDLHIGVIDNTATNPESPLVHALQRFKDRRADVHIHLHVGSPLEIEQRVVDRRIEVGIGCFPNRAPGLAYRRLFEEKHLLYCAPGHPLYGTASGNSLDALAVYEFVHRGYYAANHRMLPRDARVTATVATMEAVCMLVLTGRYLGYLPTHYAMPWVESGALRPIPINDAPCHVASFELIHRRSGSPSLAAKAFMADILQEVSTPAAAA